MRGQALGLDFQQSVSTMIPESLKIKKSAQWLTMRVRRWLYGLISQLAGFDNRVRTLAYELQRVVQHVFTQEP